jgi:hypothetical protein
MKLRNGHWLITALLLIFSSANTCAEEEGEAPVDPPAAQRQLPDVSSKQSLYLEKHMGLFNREEELTLLNTDSEEFFGLFLSERSGNPNGAVLILHDNQQHGHWPELVAPLREYLPDYGWASLTLELPDAPPPFIPARALSISTEDENSPESSDVQAQTSDQASVEDESTNSETPAESADDTPEPEDNQGPDTSAAQEVTTIEPDEEEYEPALPRLEKLPELPADDDTNTRVTSEQDQVDAEQQYLQSGRDRIKAAIQYLQQQKGQLNLAVVGVGQGAAWAIDYVSRYSMQLDPAEENKGMVIITVDPSYQEGIIPGHEQQMTDISVPYLELLTQEDAPSMFFAKRRLGKMKHAKRDGYRQIRFTQLANPGANNHDLNRRIRGWLKTNAGGTQVKLKD